MVGGFKALFNLLPFFVEICIIKEDNNFVIHKCSGSLISSDWVLTAAHCTHKNPVNQYFVRLGLSQKNAGNFKFEQVRRVKLMIQHEQYCRDTQTNDIALIKTLNPFVNITPISLVQLPVQEEKKDLAEMYKKCYGGGLGTTGPNNMQIFDHKEKKWTFTNDRQHVSEIVYVVLPLISNNQCRRIWNRDMQISFNDVTETQICTLYYPGRKSFCRGDSGGPLICGSKQYGIASCSYACGKPRIGVDVYTRVDKYIDWINKTISNASFYEDFKKYDKITNKLPFYDYFMYNYSDNLKVNTKCFLCFVFDYILYFILKRF